MNKDFMFVDNDFVINLVLHTTKIDLVMCHKQLKHPCSQVLSHVFKLF